MKMSTTKKQWDKNVGKKLPEMTVEDQLTVSFCSLECRNKNTIPFQKLLLVFQQCSSQWKGHGAMCNQILGQDKFWGGPKLDMLQEMFFLLLEKC